MSKVEHNNRRLIQRKLTAVIGTITILMVAGSTVMYFGRESTNSFPSIANNKPSGLAAFAELLTKEGYKVEIDRDERPRIADAQLVIAVEPNEKLEDMIGIPELETPPTPPIEISLANYIKNGGTVLSFQIPEDFGYASTSVSSKQIRFDNREYKVSSIDADAKQANLNSQIKDSLNKKGDQSLQESKSEVIYPNSEGYLGVTLTSGIGLTNRFIGKEDNADFHLAIIKKLAPAGSKIVFTEATFGNILNRNLSNELGNWLSVAGWQIFILVAVIMFSLGRRMGFPVEEKFSERGTHELIHSMGQVLKRGHHYDQAAMILLDETYDRMRKALRAPLGVDIPALTKQAPSELASAIVSIRQSYGKQLSRKDWQSMVTNLEKQVSVFENDVKSRHSIGIKLK